MIVLNILCFITLLLINIVNVGANLDSTFLANDKIINIVKRDCSFELQVRESPNEEDRISYKQNMHQAIIKVASMLSRIWNKVKTENIVNTIDISQERGILNYKKQLYEIFDNTHLRAEENGPIKLPQTTPNDSIYELHEYAIQLMILFQEGRKHKGEIEAWESLQYIMRDLLARLYFATHKDVTLSYLIFSPQKMYRNGLWYFYNEVQLINHDNVGWMTHLNPLRDTEVRYCTYNSFILGGFNGSVYSINYVTKTQLAIILSLIINSNPNRFEYGVGFCANYTPPIGVNKELMKLIHSGLYNVEFVTTQKNPKPDYSFFEREDIPNIPEEDIALKISKVYEPSNYMRNIEVDAVKNKKEKCIIN